MTVETNAQPADGKLDVYSLEVPHWWHLLALAPSLRRGTQGSWKHVRAFSATELKLTTRRPHDVTPMASSSRGRRRISACFQRLSKSSCPAERMAGLAAEFYRISARSTDRKSTRLNSSH